MKILREGLDPEAWWARVRDAPARVLILDYDGTLAPFTEERDRAFPYPEARDAVTRHLEDGVGRLVVVSGRALSVLRPLLGVEPPPELWGSHGWQRLVPGSDTETVDPGERARRGLERGLEAAREAAPPERVEVKPVSVAVHTRGMDASAGRTMIEAVRPRWEAAAREAELEIHTFDGGLELRVGGRDKGTAVEAILATEPADVVVAYLGDDLTDEDAFRALEGRGDRALRVLVRSELRETRADIWIRPPEELVEFLERWRTASAEA